MPEPVPDPPTGVSATYQSANDWNYITWNAVSGATSYKIYWGTSSGVTESSNVMGPTSTTDYGHSGVVPGYCYYYKVVAVDPGGESNLSSEISACVPELIDTIAPVTTASPSGGSYSTAQNVTLTCSDGSGSGCSKIYFTTDGSSPSTTSSVYSGSINIPLDTTLKFFAVDLAGNSEGIKTEVYTSTNNLTGYIRDKNSHEPLAGVVLELDSFATTTTTSDGYYVFNDISGDPHSLIASKTGYFTQKATVYSETHDIYLVPDTSCAAGNLSGYVHDASTKKSLANIKVTFNGIDTNTDASGYYEFTSIDPSSYVLSVTTTNYNPFNEVVTICGNISQDIDLISSEMVLGSETNSGFSPDPVNTATGNYYYQRQDLKIRGRGLNFAFKRYYNSQDTSTGPLGSGWNHNYNINLVENSDSTVKIRWGDGKTTTFTPDGVGGFTPQFGVFDTLLDNGDETYTFRKKNQTSYNFDVNGKLTSINDRNGNEISLAYTGIDLTGVMDSSGRQIDFTYDVNGLLIKIIDPIGRTVLFSYNTTGDLISATDTIGNVTTYTYDLDHQLLTLVDPKGNTVASNIYDNQRRVISQNDAKNGQTTLVYDDVNRKTTLTDQLGNSYRHYHDELMRLIREDDVLGNSKFYSYDAAGNRTSVTDKKGNTTSYTYDAKGNVLTKTDALGNVTSITYNSLNDPLTRTDALGNITAFEYSVTSNPIKVTDPFGHFVSTTYNSYGQPLTITDSRGNTSSFAYDIEGNLVGVTDALGNISTYTYDGAGRRLSATDALGRITTYSYDGNNNLLSTTDPLGNVASSTYDGNDNMVTVTDPLLNTTTYTYDVRDLLAVMTDPQGHTISYSYDSLDRKISATDKNGNSATFSYDEIGNLLAVTDPLGNITSYTYDANGNRLTATSPLGQTTTYTYDALKRVVSVTDPLGNSAADTYDALGRTTAVTNAKGQTTSFEYDALGRLVKVIDPEGGTVIYTYDENGNRLTKTEPNGNVTTYSYDALNRLIQKKEPLGNTYQYVYDSAGNLISQTDAKSNIITYTYDANNRMTGITYPDTSTVTFTYDANGNRTAMVDSLGNSTYSYDSLNRLTSCADPFGKIVGYGYDSNGNRINLTYPGSKIVNYSYDPLNRLTGVTDWLNNTTTYTYDAASRLTDTLNPNSTTVSYTYDTADRLTGLVNAKSDTTVISSYNYTLDQLGNHVQVIKDEPLLPVLTDALINYSYDAENRLTNAGGTLQAYDANGNLTAKGNDSFVYDFNDRLIQSDIAGVIGQYNYDGLGNRFAKTEDGVTTRYIIDVNGRLTNVLAETDDLGAITAYYVYGLGLISKILPDGTASYYHYDSRGSTVALTDAGHNITDSYAYSTFGSLSNVSGATSNPFKYLGRYGVMDEGNGLDYIRARYYSPERGRFISKDVLTGKDSDSQSLNRYVYTSNNPIVFIDISGFSAQEGSFIWSFSTSSDEENDYLISYDYRSANSTPITIDETDGFELCRLSPFIYGNYGGGGWTGGECGGNFDVDPVDTMDNLFRMHDKMYDVFKNDPYGRYRADYYLVEGLKEIGSPENWENKPTDVEDAELFRQEALLFFSSMTKKYEESKKLYSIGTQAPHFSTPVGGAVNIINLFLINKLESSIPYP